MEFLALAVFLGVFAVVLALLSGHPLAWFKNEWRLLRTESWEAGRARITGATSSEERAARLLMRQRALSKRMRRSGKHLLADRQYEPALTAPKEPAAAPPKADRVVVPMRQGRRG